MSQLAEKIAHRYDGIVHFFRERPFGKYMEDLSILSILPPVDRCLIIEGVIQHQYGYPIAWVDKLALAYLKAGWDNLAHEIVQKFYHKGWLPSVAYSMILEKLSTVAPSNVSVDYEDTLNKLLAYDYEETALGKLIKELCEQFVGQELLTHIDMCDPFQVADLMDFINERREFIVSL